MLMFYACQCPFVEQCRYLGTTISIKNSDLDLKRQMRKMYANANIEKIF